MKPNLSDTTLIAVDTTPKSHLALRGIEESLKQCSFGAVKLLTNNSKLKYAVTIPELRGLEGYSKFCIRNLTDFVDTKYCIVCQADGFLVNGSAWTDEFKNFDWIGAPWNPSGVIGNGGLSWRSKKLLDACAALKTRDNEHPEDQWISVRHKEELEAMGIKIAPIELARRFAFEGRSYNGKEWSGVPNEYNGAMGFHSWLSKLPKHVSKPKVYHHSLDSGDCVYGAAVIKALGGGVLFISPDNKYPYPLNSRWARMGGDAAGVDNLKPLLEHQSYIDRVQYTHGTPFSTDFDLNKFRLPWRNRSARDFDSILKLHCDAFGVKWDESKPWLAIDNPIVVPGRPIVVARSPRYNNLNFDWHSLVQKHHEQMVFVGTPEEAEIFQGFAAPHFTVPHYETKDALELGRVIAGAKCCVMNQSLPLAIAHGLAKRVVVEQWQSNPNCRLNRVNACYDRADIFQEWLQ